MRSQVEVPGRSVINVPMFILAVIAAGSVAAQSDTLPPLNLEVVAFVHDHMGKKIGRGECWDLAAAALDHVHAKWDGGYGFGEVVDWRKDSILPGDIVQFEGVTIVEDRNGITGRSTLGHHTAIIMAVRGRGAYTIGHQNFGRDGRKVSLFDFDMSEVRGGKLMFYRPVPGG